MNTPYQLTNSDRAFAKAYDSSVGEHDSEVVFDAIKQFHNEEVYSVVSKSILDAYCLWNRGIDYGVNLFDMVTRKRKP